MPQATPSDPSPSAPATGTATPLAATVALDGPRGSLAGVDGAATVIEWPLPSGGTGAVVVTRGGSTTVGPLRAAVGGDTALATMWHADVVTARASTAAVAAQRAEGLAVVEEGTGDGAVLRDPARRAPHNAYAVADAARTAAGRAVPTPATNRGTPWTVGAPPVAGGHTVERVAVRAATGMTVVWTWDPASATWRRVVAGDRHRAAGGGQVATGTVIVAETAAGRPGELRGVGVAVVLRAGRRYAAGWRRHDVSDAPRIEQPDGAPFPIEGTVWLHLCAAPCARRIAPSARRPASVPR